MIHQTKTSFIKVFSALTLAVLLCPAAFPDALGAKKEIIVGAFDFNPAIYKGSDGSIKGFYTELFDAIARKENWSIRYVYGSWAEGLERIKNGDIDIMVSVARTPERETYMDYMETPVLTVWGEAYVHKNSSLSTLFDLQGKKIAVMKNDFNGTGFITRMQSFEIYCQYVEYPDFDHVLHAVEKSQVDAGVVSSIYGAGKSMHYRVKDTGIVFNPFPIYFTTAKGKNAELRTKINSYLTQWKADTHSLYHTSMKKWLRRDVGIHEVISLKLIIILSVVSFGLLLFISVALLLRYKIRKAIVKISVSERNLRESRNILATILNSLPQSVFWKDSNSVYQGCNSAFAEFNELSSPEQITGKTDVDLPIHSSHAKMYQQRDAEVISEKKAAYGIIEHIQNKDGADQWIETTKIPLIDEDGNANGILGIFTDITQWKKAEEKIQNSLLEKETLLRELYHRTKNNMQVISSMLQLQTAYTDSPGVADVFAAMRNRIHSMALIHQKLYQSKNLSNIDLRGYIEELVPLLIDSHHPVSGRISFDMDLKRVSTLIDTAIPFGLVVCEIISNIFKHSFPGQTKGNVVICLSDHADTIELVIKDNGIGFPEGFDYEKSGRLGMMLIYTLVEKQLQGSLSIAGPPGAQYTIKAKNSLYQERV